MAKSKIRDWDNSALWHIVFAPFMDRRTKAQALAELRRRGQYGEPIVEIKED